MFPCSSFPQQKTEDFIIFINYNTSKSPAVPVSTSDRGTAKAIAAKIKEKKENPNNK